jgi:hypothetical protein
MLESCGANSTLTLILSPTLSEIGIPGLIDLIEKLGCASSKSVISIFEFFAVKVIDFSNFVPGKIEEKSSH